MTVPAPIRRKLDGMRQDLEILAVNVRDAVLNFCEDKGFAYTGRVKTLESLAEKLETGRYGKWSEIDDLFGCSVVVPTRLEEDEVFTFLNNAFVAVKTKRRGETEKHPEVFRFDASSFLGRLHTAKSTEAEFPLYNIRFEVQVRTAFEHAWAVSTHALAYKSGKIDWKTKRLAAQLKAAVEQLDTLILASEAAAIPIVEHSHPELATLQQIVNSFSTLLRDGTIQQEAKPKDWSRFAENLRRLLGSSPIAPRNNREAWIQKAIGNLVKRITSTETNRMPQSLSLFQFCFALLTRDGVLQPPLHKYCPLITPELEELYREVEQFTERFMFNE